MTDYQIYNNASGPESRFQNRAPQYPPPMSTVNEDINGIQPREAVYYPSAPVTPVGSSGYLAGIGIRGDHVDGSKSDGSRSRSPSNASPRNSHSDGQNRFSRAVSPPRVIRVEPEQPDYQTSSRASVTNEQLDLVSRHYRDEEVRYLNKRVEELGQDVASGLRSHILALETEVKYLRERLKELLSSTLRQD